LLLKFVLGTFLIFFCLPVATLTTEHTDLQSRHSQLRDVLRAAQAALISAQQQHEQTVHDLAVAKTEVQRLSGVQTQARLLLAATLTQQSTPADVTGVQSMMQATTTSVNASSTPSTNQNSSWISAVQSLSEPSSQPSARVPLGRLLNPASASNAPSLTPSTSLQPVLDVNTIANGSASAWWDEVATEFACVRQLLTAQSDADRKLAELALLAQKEESSGGSIAQRMSAAVQSKGLTAQQQAQLQQQQQLQSNAELIQRKLAWICVTLLMFGRLNLPSAPSTSPATPLVVGATSTPATQTLQMQPFQSAGTLSLTLRAAAPAGRRNTHYYQPFYRYQQIFSPHRFCFYLLSFFNFDDMLIFVGQIACAGSVVAVARSFVVAFSSAMRRRRTPVGGAAPALVDHTCAFACLESFFRFFFNSVFLVGSVD
jgi:hypothetical protein